MQTAFPFYLYLSVFYAKMPCVGGFNLIFKKNFMVADYMYSVPACEFLHRPGDYYSYWYLLSKSEILVVLLYLLRWITFNFCFGSAFLMLGLFWVERSDVSSWQIQKS